jgi:CHAT domain-containing protein
VPGSRGLDGAASEAAALLSFLPEPVLLADPGLADPSRSKLLLTDHDTAPLTVISLAPVKLDHAQLAYLSACRTAITDNAKLIDESIHLTSAFQLAGFPQVIGTLWDIEDEGAATIATDFYEHLTTDVPVPGNLDSRRAAHALHEVTLALRDRLPGRPSLWAAYTHSGA